MDHFIRSVLVGCRIDNISHFSTAVALQSFSAIVGPNGSGKSNTIDALLFVFGYRATKMRQGKLSELIHNSAKFPDLQECSVEVHFREIMDLVSGNNIAAGLSVLTYDHSLDRMHSRSYRAPNSLSRALHIRTTTANIQSTVVQAAIRRFRHC